MTSSIGVENSRESQSAAAAPEATAAAAYDRAPVDQDVTCPLCDYNLRGTTEPRCPECGYTFEWRDLLDPDRRRHPYLFEHHPRRNVWSFWRTFAGALWPSRFWWDLRPGQPSNVRRLVVYWVAVNILAVALPLTMVGADMTRYAIHNHQNHARMRATASRAWVEATYPLPPSPRFFEKYFWEAGREILAPALMFAAVYLAWPWLTFLALNIFQISMLRARVNVSHVLRCVVYTFDVLFLFVGGVAIAAMTLVTDAAYLRRTDEALFVLMPFWMLAAVGIFNYRLTTAYRLYLQFHRPLLTVVASQVVVALAAFTAFLWVVVWNEI